MAANDAFTAVSYTHLAADHGTVKADIPCLECGHDLDLCTDKVLFRDAVLLVQQDHGVQLDSCLLYTSRCV